MNKCLQCGLSTKTKFCSKSCAAKYNNARRSSLSREKQKKTLLKTLESKGLNISRSTHDIYCSICNKILPEKNKKYCSEKCKERSRYLKYQNGQYTESYALKRYVIKDKGYHCEICRISTWKNRQLTLQLDHIDGNSDNNYPNNLRLLCPNCHSQTETYKGGNRNKLKNSKRNRRHRDLYKKDRIELAQILLELTAD